MSHSGPVGRRERRAARGNRCRPPRVGAADQFFDAARTLSTNALPPTRSAISAITGSVALAHSSCSAAVGT